MVVGWLTSSEGGLRWARNIAFFVFLINDQYVYELTDNEIKNGGFGYGIGLYHADLHNTFEFDNFIIQAP